MRQYQSIWNKIKEVPVGETVSVKVHGTRVKTLRQAVLKEKCIETSAKKKLGMRFAGRLEIAVETEGVNPSGYAIVHFKLSWDGTRL